MQANSPKSSSKSSIKFSNLHFDLSLEQKVQKEIPYFSFWHEAAQLAPLTGSPLLTTFSPSILLAGNARFDPFRKCGSRLIMGEVRLSGGRSAVPLVVLKQLIGDFFPA